ncbi:MAG: hypothetical protein A2Y12_19185 [Planctomycetes bacterium GWF2_42_9]|nr:MAG: hypothetical protein A2Y12_19185 [Planctomycetes bacterium GWF2_42_9]
MKLGLIEWLKGPDGRVILLECAEDIEYHARKKSLNLAHIFREEFVSDANELRRIVASELTTYLLEHQDAVTRDISEDVSKGDISAVTAKIVTKFLSHVIDKRRTYPVSPFHAFQRHLRKVISQATEVRYIPTDNGSYYAYTDAVNIDYLPYTYWGLAFDGWSSPSVPLAEVEEQAGMLCLSRFYWDEATCRYETEYLLPLLELTRFVFAKYPLIAQRKDVGAGGVDGMTETEKFDLLKPVHLAGDPLGPLQRQSDRLDYDIIEYELSKLADQCCAGLDERQTEILWRASDGQTLDEIARRLGEKGPSNIQYHLKKAQSHIRKFWLLWGNAQLPGFAEEDEEEQFIFVEKIVQHCKEHYGGREGI